jgi:hypothetical protein
MKQPSGRREMTWASSMVMSSPLFRERANSPGVRRSRSSWSAGFTWAGWLEVTRSDPIPSLGPLIALVSEIYNWLEVKVHAHHRGAAACQAKWDGNPQTCVPSVSRDVIHSTVARAISVRLDDDADKALRTLEATGMSQSEAIRSALLGEVRQLRRSRELAAEMVAVAEMMEALRAPG